jgi:hypothetical protein
MYGREYPMAIVLLDGCLRILLNGTNLLSLKPEVDRIDIQGTLMIVGCDEDDNMIFRLSGNGIVC